ncbi:YcaO-like family protein [Bradyrhizobium sp.]|jgi:ribosomal protein S12 methylthiotransferase accessory factor|uniref:YcaO-like family protein n=1 Tax=Bradyrhizobium sp. TaxID=376 RepID=UPI002DF86439|nr:YcaO-like family protein [Bradyrhizobium sp.]
MTAAPWDLLVSSRTGLVTELLPQHRGPEEPVPPYLCTAMLAHFDFRAAPRQERLNAGKGRTEDEAKLSALGEAVERYAAYHLDPARLSTGPAPSGAITPADCVLYSQAQYAQEGFAFRPWTEDAEISWIGGTDLNSGEAVPLPAALVHLVYPMPRAEDHFTAVTSNGLAAGPTLARAILGGLYETIERDALMITWMNRLPAIELDAMACRCHAATIVRHYRRFGVAVRLLKIATDQLPHVIMAVAEDSDPARPARLIGMGCDLNPVVACDKAAFEMCQARPSEAVRYREKPPAGRLKTYEDVKDLDDHPGFHAMPENFYEFDFLKSGAKSVSLGDLTGFATGDGDADLAAVAARLKETGARAAYADITMPDVAEAGYRVVRAIATGLQPIHFGWGQARLGGRRLFEAPMRWGFAGAPSTPETLNYCPHPLA